LRHSTARPDVAQQAARLLVRHDRKPEALELLSRAERSAPDNADLLLMKAIVLGLTGRDAESEKTLRQLEYRWPEWDRTYIVHGLLLERQARTTEARQKIQTAIALGSPDLAPRCAAARLAGSPAPDPKCGCVKGLYELLFPACVK
jgi:Flp pilus assembly protein TadD